MYVIRERQERGSSRAPDTRTSGPALSPDESFDETAHLASSRGVAPAGE